MATLNVYESAAAKFRQHYPIGTRVRGEEILTWAHDHADGLASDLLISDDNKKLLALRRHLNAGGASRTFAEGDRFHVETVDAKRKVYRVERLADHVNRQAEVAFGKSISGALSPLKRSEKAINDIKLEELEDDERAQTEQRLQELVDMAQPLRKVFSDRVIQRWIGKLEAKGYTADQARNLIEVLPTLQREMKLLKATS